MYGEEDSGYDEELQSQINLHTAVLSGSVKELESILADGETDLLAYYDGNTTLHTAVTSGRSDVCDVINLLLDNGADKDAKTTGDGNTALHLAVINGNFPLDFDLIVLFLEAKVDLSVRNKALRTPYDCAMACGQYELAGCLDGTVKSEDAREFYTSKIAERYGPFIIEAVLESNEKKLGEYLHIGGNPNFINKHGAGAIHYAITHCKLPVYDTLLLLLHAKADANLQDEEGDTALNLVIKSKKLRSNGEMVRCVQLLMDSGAKSDIRDIDNKDACILAEEKDYDDVLAILKGPTQRRKTPSPKPPEENTSPEPLPQEEEEEITPSPKPPEENTSPEPLPQEEEEEITPREDVNAPNSDGLYPIHVATMKENKVQRHDKISSLLDRGALIDAKIVDSGNTSLHICAEKDYGETAKLLLDNHIDYTIKNKNDKTAYDLAQTLGHESVCQAIEDKRHQVQENWQRAGRKAKFCTIL